MALPSALPVEFALASPHGAYAATGFEPVRDFEQSRAGHAVQATDRASGQPLWALDLIDADPAAKSRTLRVKIAAHQEPTLPPAQPGFPFIPISLRTSTPPRRTPLRLTPGLTCLGCAARQTRRTQRTLGDEAMGPAWRASRQGPRPRLVRAAGLAPRRRIRRHSR